MELSSQIRARSELVSQIRAIKTELISLKEIYYSQILLNIKEKSKD